MRGCVSVCGCCTPHQPSWHNAVPAAAALSPVTATAALTPATAVGAGPSSVGLPSYSPAQLAGTAWSLAVMGQVRHGSLAVMGQVRAQNMAIAPAGAMTPDPPSQQQQ